MAIASGSCGFTLDTAVGDIGTHEPLLLGRQLTALGVERGIDDLIDTGCRRRSTPSLNSSSIRSRPGGPLATPASATASRFGSATCSSTLCWKADQALEQSKQRETELKQRALEIFDNPSASASRAHLAGPGPAAERGRAGCARLPAQGFVLSLRCSCQPSLRGAEGLAAAAGRHHDGPACGAGEAARRCGAGWFGQHQRHRRGCRVTVQRRGLRPSSIN
jgi:hypothetical protein